MQLGHMRLCSLVTAALLLILSGCGGGSSAPAELVSAEPAALQAPPEARIKRLDAGASSAADSASAIALESMTLTQERRVGRTIFEYTFSLNVVNGGPAVQSATLTLTATGTGTTIVDGSVAIGALAAGAKVTPSDTITIRHDRTIAFNPAAFVWHVVAVNVPPVEDVPGVDANSNGVRDDVEAYIAGAYPASAVRDAMMQVAAGLQLTATAVTAEDRLAAETARVAAGLCLADKSTPAQAAQLIAVVQGKQLNTPERARLEMAFRDSLAGKTVTASASVATGSSCK